jgi:hypothetical protein
MKEIFLEDFFFGDFFSFFWGKVKKKLLLLSSITQGRGPNFPFFWEGKKRKKRKSLVRIFFFDFFKQILGTP